jgi:hypothetical protein
LRLLPIFLTFMCPVNTKHGLSSWKSTCRDCYSTVLSKVQTCGLDHNFRTCKLAHDLKTHCLDMQYSFCLH